MVTDRNKNSDKTRIKQGAEKVSSEANKINASTPYDFAGRNLTPYGGLLPVITMLENLGFQALVEQTVTSKRISRAMDLYRFVLGIVLGLYIGFPRLNQLRFIARDPILTGILKVGKLPVQSTFWRFVNALHSNFARQILVIMRTMRERVWEAANVNLAVVTIDTDTTVHTLYGQQMGGRKGYNPKNKGKRSYQPMLTFIAETREYVWGGLRNGDRPTGKQIRDHIRSVCAALPSCVKQAIRIDIMIAMSQIVLLLLTCTVFACAAELPSKKYLNLAAIKTLVATAEAEMQKHNVQVTICIMDESGNLLFLQKADGAGLNTIQFAQRKAKYAALYGRPSKAAQDSLKGGDLSILAFPDGFPNQGGLPIKVDGKTIGSMACSGAKSEVDEAITQAAIDALLK